MGAVARAAATAGGRRGFKAATSTPSGWCSALSHMVYDGLGESHPGRQIYDVEYDESTNNGHPFFMITVLFEIILAHQQRNYNIWMIDWNERYVRACVAYVIETTTHTDTLIDLN